MSNIFVIKPDDIYREHVHFAVLFTLDHVWFCLFLFKLAKATSSSHNTLSNNNNSNTKCIADNKNEKYGCDKLVGDFCIFEAWLNDDNLNWFWPLQFYILKCSATVVVAQLAQWSLPTPDDPGSNPAISNFNKEHLLTETVYKMKIKKRQSGKNFRRNKLIIDSFKCDKHRQVFRAA